MIKKKENCEYCGEKMESKTAKKRFCSDKCRVYFNRQPKSGGSIIVEFKKLDKIAANLGVSKPNADNDTKFYKEPVELTLNQQPKPPVGLKGIDLVIWKSENWK
jgi:hypothetical protein